MRWFQRGDIDGFFGLAVDNLVQLLLIDALCRHVLGFSDALLYGQVLPGAAVSLLVGNLYYAWQARRLGQALGRSDICALPYGINTVSVFAHVFLVMLPAKLAATAAGAADPTTIAWQAGLVACFGSGLIELSGAFVAERLRKATPRAALLSTLSGVALGFISLGFLYRSFARPVVGLVTLGVLLLVYFGRLKFKGGVPGGLVAVALGTLIAWLTGIAPVGEAPVHGHGLQVPLPVLGPLIDALTGDMLWAYLAVIVPMGVFNVVGSLQNIEAAEAAGDPFPTTPSLAMNGLGTLAAALFGSCFPTTIYIGHPGWKAMGARAGYSILNGVFATLVCLTGTLAYIAWAVPIEAGMAIILWIGIVITAQAFEATPREHAPAVVIGILPGVGAWGAMMAKAGLRAGGVDGMTSAMSPALVPVFQRADVWIDGAFALEQGFIFTSMFLAAATVAVIERKLRQAAAWCFAGAALSALGFMHSYVWTPADTVLSLSPAWPFVQGYFLMGLVFLVAPLVTTRSDGPAH
ncbi:NCS2 family permease [Nannocystis sp. ILAH1]|uniref:NCS2 family permease n=1 Tax=unclassified Nannocystis TaxID=2627009 RepID=UPI002271D0C3|nr:MULTISPECIES: NCS2 family permease [unclassified Nannocystis]MCY0991728.1 NCS2 family permease [Nannocystis sp. ILAH1]MCY1067276.1 NCS2 family permease [Nannocystis sp. RBIL2]